MVSTCKSLRVRVCICGVGTYKLMFSCKNVPVFCERICWYMNVSVQLVHICVYVYLYEYVYNLIGIFMHLLGCLILLYF